MKPDDRNDREQDEQNQSNQLGDLERLLGLRRRHRMQCRYFFERLHNQNENIEIERNNCADDVNPTPRAAEIPGAKRVNRNGENDC